MTNVTTTLRTGGFKTWAAQTVPAGVYSRARA
ncbi:hypothetical protein C8J27_106243 [Rhodobacter aestuarii]|uniref:Uncharacterized protein n=1 Tax=Rhodobacter aestuarii TaxID=453582 RepID=A0A1N7MBK0_9RHOB|nr:hypothetical protein C8J27_106243 [Rhodobacter aestuarii]SIS83440.1 hypothetical protein SAMN05421580_105243 [Rhodobacter aestuarii]SOB97835.1 hypothetical protein SAMN05877809_10246 [Rhodobacter sp. JA431]